MTERQKRFAEECAANPNAAEAARRAGYTKKTARQTGQRLLTKADIAAYIRRLQDEAAEARIATAQDIKAFWSQTMNDERERTAVRLKASELLAKAAGMFLPQEEDKPGISEDDVVIYLPEIDAEETCFAGAVSGERAE
ncbi:MAG: terminase small subunit [Clostridiales bacterium]|nr:terminase small subunit [Clostridiales bacterium]